jgi:UTP--glucose-1-phosphate uridylyltransferase
MVCNILTEGVECIFVRQLQQLGLGHAVLCAERVITGDPFAILLADHSFLIDYAPGVTSDLTLAYEKLGRSQLLFMAVHTPDIFNYGVVVPSQDGYGMIGLVEKPEF